MAIRIRHKDPDGWGTLNLDTLPVTVLVQNDRDETFARLTFATKDGQPTVEVLEGVQVVVVAGFKEEKRKVKK